MYLNLRLSALAAMLWLCCVVQSFGTVTLPFHPRGSTKWAAAKLNAALATVFLPTEPIDIVVAAERDRSLPPESFTIQPDADRLTIRSADPNGELYGLLELTERIESQPAKQSWHNFASQFAPIRQTPFVSFRADNSFLHIDRKGISYLAQKAHLIGPPLLFEDVGMWKQYIDQLAENRFNVLDLHGVYNVSATTFHNLLPFLVTVPEYPGVGNKANQARNLRSLRKIVSYANKRGIQLGLMNYSARVDGLSETAWRDYTEKAVAKLLVEVPKLKLFGFRVGESGEAAQFYADAYLKGVRDSGRTNVQLYTRSWKTTAKELDAMAESMKGTFDVEVKYNGEQLGLPYQALLGPANLHYSYADSLQPGRHYAAIWQVRANGTHRFWTWANTEFIRRTIRTLPFGEAKGFSLEPESAYFNFYAAPWYRQKADGAIHRYIWEKNWPWYLAWGRLAFDPDLPEQTLARVYRQHFGAAGDKVYEALQASGQIVPLAMAYRFTGPDQRNMSPETQSAAFDTVKHAAITPLSFAENSPMDSRAFVGIDDFVTDKVAGKIDARISPVRVAAIFEKASTETQTLVASLDSVLAGNKEWRILRTDLAGAGSLGAYYAARITGTMHLDYALKTGSQPDYDQAMEALAKSRAAWKQLADTADAIYTPIQNPLIGQKDFTWASETKRLEKLDATIPAMWARVARKDSAKSLIFAASERRERLSFSVKEISHKMITPGSAQISFLPEPAANAATATLWFKDFPSDAPWKSLPMTTGADGKFTATVPVHAGGLLYSVEARDAQGGAAQFPNALTETPYRVLSENERTANVEKLSVTAPKAAFFLFPEGR